MRLITRFATSTAATGLLLFGAYGVWLVKQEREDLRSSVEREVLFLFTSVQTAAENALRDAQVSDVREVTLRLDSVDTEVDLYVLDRAGELVVAPSNGTDAGPANMIREVTRGSDDSGVPRLIWVPTLWSTHVIVASQLLDDDGADLGQLVLVRPLDDMNQDLLETSGSVALTVGLFTLLGTSLGLLIGHFRLVGPLEQLTTAIRKVHRGEADVVPSHAMDDELALLAVEFNRMVDDLGVAKAAAAAEAEARRDAMRTLQVADRFVTVGQLSAAVAHEIGSPLQVLLGRARSLVDRPDDPDRTRRTAEIMVRESERISRIVGQLLAVTRSRPLDRSPVDLLAAARHVAALLELEARRVGATLDVTGEPTEVSAHPDQVDQVLLNLLTNALAAGPTRATVRVSRADDHARIDVQDDGCGMDAETRAHAFEPLFTTRADRGGTGLGLVVVQSIVQDHGGRVFIDPSVVEGSRICVELPLGRAA